MACPEEIEQRYSGRASASVLLKTETTVPRAVPRSFVFCVGPFTGTSLRGSGDDPGMPALRSLIPDASTVTAMHPADLAGYILTVLLDSADDRSKWNRRNFCMSAGSEFAPPGESGDRAVMEACAVAWSWLAANWLICEDPEDSNDWYIPTPRGREVRDRIGVRRLVEQQELPAHFLHAALVIDVLPLFMQGRFDQAVFGAFHLLEVTIRETAHLGNDLIGKALASRAFHPMSGELSDMAAEAGERQALMSLMCGAIGSYKNPQSHRHVGLNAPQAREMIMMASHLIGIVESRRNGADTPSQLSGN